ncbi:MAG: PAS domain-containing protein, partial [Pseudomonadota bacterium]|nr:PAS domain-containing protein [Pseudomonadota bacterium]
MAYDGEPRAADETDFLTGGGEMGALMRARDWSGTSLGPIDDWPQSLRITLCTMLGSSHAMCLAWGPALTLFYNDAYVPFLRARHPAALGEPLDRVWSDVWKDIAPFVERAMAGESVQVEDLPLDMTRHEDRQMTWWTFTYSPVRDESGAVAGMLDICSESTDRLIGQRRSDEVQERQRQMLRQMPGFVAMLSGPELIYTYVNEAYVEISERTDFISRRFRDVFADITGQGFHELFENVFHSGEGVVTRGMELHLHGRDEAQYIDFVLEPIRNDEGIITGVFVGGYETTDVYRGNQALRDSETRLAFLDRLGAETTHLADADAVLATTTRLLGEHLGLSVCAYADMDEDQDGFTIRGDWAAPGSTSIVGHYSLADFGKLAVKNLGAGLPLVVHDNLLELAPEEAATFQNIGIAATICMPLVKNGRLAALMAIHDRVPRIWTDAELSLLREVTSRSWAHVERFAALADLRESEERQRLVLDSAPGGFYSVDREGTTNLVSRGFIEMMGFGSDKEVLGRKLHGLIHHSHPNGTPYPVEQCPIYRCASIGEVAHVPDELFFRLDGSPVPVEYWVAPIIRDGEHIGAICTVLDLTQRKAAETALRESEARLRELNETLEQRVEARTAELVRAQDALRQSQKLEAMGQLTGGVAHDFNNLLTPIVGSLDLLQRRGLGDAREQRLIEGALQSAERARVLVQRLLAFARRQPLLPSAVDVADLIAGMAELVASTSGPNIKLEVAVADDLPPALADPNQLEMAILNLAVNARDAMRDGGTLTIAAADEQVAPGHRSGLTPGRFVHLSVADNGAGMDDATVARAIEPFFSTKGIGKGTGLGLSMVHGLASQLGGALAVSSKPGLGTRVDLWLPVSAAPADEAAPEPDAPPRADTLGT